MNRPNSKRFSSHGKFDLRVEKNIVFIKAEGPGNTEIVRDYQQQFLPVLELLRSERWGTIVELIGLPLMPPDGSQLLIEGTRLAKANGHVAAAIVLDSECQTSICREYWKNLYQQAEVNHAFFADLDEAEKWLTERFLVKE